MSENEQYKELMAGVFSRSSETYGQVGPKFFTYFGKRLVEVADIQAGAKVLDVACGRGAVLFPTVEAVGETGSVTGIDIAEGMVERLSADISARGLTNADVMLMDAEKLEFREESFDNVISGFSFFFYPNLNRALVEFLQVLKPGGQMATTTFDAHEAEMREEFKELAKNYQDRLKSIPEVESAALDSVEEINEVFGYAGFVNIECRIETKTFYYQDEDEWWDVRWSHGMRSFLERMSDEVLASYKDDAIKIVQAHKTELGIPDTISVIFSTARKARG